MTYKSWWMKLLNAVTNPSLIFMIKKPTIKNELGLHARASNKLATEAAKFKSKIEIILMIK